jgi:hypothetical protein
MQVKMCIKEEGLLRTQCHALTTRNTRVSTLARNARRGGAQGIEMAHDEVSGSSLTEGRP